MTKVLSNKDYNNNEIQNAKLQPVATDPSSLGAAHASRVWFNTGGGLLKVWNGTAADTLTNLLESVAVADSALTVSTASKVATLGVAAASGSQRGTLSPALFNLLSAATSAATASALVQRDASGNFSAGTITAALTGTASNATQLNGQAASYYLNLANMATGSLTSARISDLATTVQAYRLDQFAAPTNPVSAGSQRITSVATPTASTDATNKSYADAISAAAEKTANKSTIASKVPNGYIGADANGLIDSSFTYAAQSSYYGVIQLAGDLGGTAGAPTVPGLASKAPIANPTFTGTVTLAQDPTQSLHAVTKQYVDNIATGLDIKPSVKYGTIAALPANSYSNGVITASANGALSVDGTAVAVNDRIMVKNEATQANNGLYVVTNAGSGSAAFVLTRSSDADNQGNNAEVSGGMFTFVEGGGSLGGTGWVLAGTGVATLGTTALVFTQFTGGAAYTNGVGLALSANQFSVIGTANRISVSASGVDISANYVGQSSITTLGTITTGIWNGSTIAVANGGTGATSVAGAKTALGFKGGAAGDIPATAANTAYVFTHNLGTTDIVPMVQEKSTGNFVEADFTATTTTQISVTFGAAVTASQYRIIVVG